MAKDYDLLKKLTSTSKTLKRGEVNKHFKEISEALEEGFSTIVIYETLKNDGKITSSYVWFAKVVAELQKTTKANVESKTNKEDARNETGSGQLGETNKSQPKQAKSVEERQFRHKAKPSKSDINDLIG